MGLVKLVTEAYNKGKRQKQDEDIFYSEGIGAAILGIYSMDYGVFERRNREREEIFNRSKPTGILQRAIYKLGYYIG